MMHFRNTNFIDVIIGFSASLSATRAVVRYRTPPPFMKAAPAPGAAV
jgi:hypothetical protein